MNQHLARVGIPRRTGVAEAIDYMGGGVWRLWLHTPNYIHGTYLLLYSDGKVTRVTEVADGPPETLVVRYADGYYAAAKENGYTE